MKNSISILVIALVVLGGIFLLSDKQSKVEDTMVKEDAQPTMTTDEQKGDAMMAQSGTYETYAMEKVAMQTEGNYVVLFFRASWCPSCIALDKDIRANLSSIPASLTILDVDYDNSSELKKKHGVTYQHTFVQVDKDGNMIKKWSGSSTLSSLVEEVY